jgi:hypothetical protein
MRRLACRRRAAPLCLPRTPYALRRLRLRAFSDSLHSWRPSSSRCCSASWFDEAHIYVDDGISGAEFAARPGFVRLMNALKPRAAVF